ncbi:MAG: RcnB family protein [Rhizobiaceae bacterium]|nr:RcnB family protein [Rhizobiaceae bacterium]
MKRFVLSALAATMLALPAVSAQAAPVNSQPIVVADMKHGPVVKRKVEREVVRKDRFGREIVVKRTTTTTRWVRGHRVPYWQRQNVVRDYRYHGLRRPGPGQQWVKVNNDYLLIAAASGVIAGVIAAN